MRVYSNLPCDIVLPESLHFSDEMNDADIDRFVSMSYAKRSLLSILEAEAAKLHEIMERYQGELIFTSQHRRPRS